MSFVNITVGIIRLHSRSAAFCHVVAFAHLACFCLKKYLVFLACVCMNLYLIIFLIYIFLAISFVWSIWYIYSALNGTLQRIWWYNDGNAKVILSWFITISMYYGIYMTLHTVVTYHVKKRYFLLNAEEVVYCWYEIIHQFTVFGCFLKFFSSQLYRDSITFYTVFQSFYVCI